MAVKNVKLQEYIDKAQGRRILFVEGRDDTHAFEPLLKKQFGPEWESLWTIIAAGNKRQVMAITQQASNAIGVVDRDEWDDEVVDKHQNDIANLFVLPRHCVESFLTVPQEVSSCLLNSSYRSRFEKLGGTDWLEDAVVQRIAPFIRHGVLRIVIRPMWDELRGLGFNKELLDWQENLTDEKINEKLNQWHNLLKPSKVLADFHQRLATVEANDLATQLKRFVHGKVCFEQLICPLLQQVTGQIDNNILKHRLFELLPLPKDLEPLWQKMGLC